MINYFFIKKINQIGLRSFYLDFIITGFYISSEEIYINNSNLLFRYHSFPAVVQLHNTVSSSHIAILFTHAAEFDTLPRLYHL